MTLSTLTGCVTKADAKDGSSTSSGAGDENVINVYTALEDEQVTDYLEEFKEENPDVTVNVTRESTGIITSKLLAEKDNPVADVVWGLSATSLLVLLGTRTKTPEPYEPGGADRILPGFKDSADVPSWVGISMRLGNCIHCK